MSGEGYSPFRAGSSTKMWCAAARCSMAPIAAPASDPPRLKELPANRSGGWLTSNPIAASVLAAMVVVLELVKGSGAGACMYHT
jgi:hypothetical protein